VRILYVATGVPFPLECGGTTHIREVAQELRRRGHELILCVRAEPGLEEGMVEGFRVHRFSWRNRDMAVSQVVHRWSHGTRVARLAKRYDVDLIYERENSMGSGAIASQLVGLPLTAEINDLWYSPKTLERAGRIISNSGSVKGIIPERYHDKTVFVHMAADTKAFVDVEPATIPGTEGRRLMCYMGSLLAWHGIPDLVDALPSVHQRVPDATLLLLGKATTSEGQMNMAALEEMAATVGDPSLLHPMGLVDHNEVPGVLASCDLCVAPFNPSGEPDLLKYGFWYSPTKLWEYMAAGKPVVATDLDNIRDIVGTDRGILVPPGDPAALADALVKVLTDDDLRRRMGESSLAFARDNTWERRVDEYEQAIVETLEGGK
jgi:glycosyltransferase involved in cell wall biosynthesis